MPITIATNPSWFFPASWIVRGSDIASCSRSRVGIYCTTYFLNFYYCLFIEFVIMYKLEFSIMFIFDLYLVIYFLLL